MAGTFPVEDLSICVESAMINALVSAMEHFGATGFVRYRGGIVKLSCCGYYVASVKLSSNGK